MFLTCKWIFRNIHRICPPAYGRHLLYYLPFSTLSIAILALGVGQLAAEGVDVEGEFFYYIAFGIFFITV